MLLSQERVAGTTANLHVSDGPTPAQDGLNTREGDNEGDGLRNPWRRRR
jgi:hypothetical protein